MIIRMKEKNIDTKFVILFSVLMLCVIPLIIFLYCNLRAYILYETALNKSNPTIKSEKINYYNEVFSLLTEAISLNKGNAEYLAKKGDFIAEAIKEDLNMPLSLEKNEVENLYKEAINLNPTNFNYHLKLGSFYASIGDPKAEEELSKAITLYPVYYKAYNELCKYYLSENKQDFAFKYLLLSRYYYPRSNYSFNEEILVGLRKELAKNNRFIFYNVSRELGFFIFTPGNEFDFKKNGFPHTENLMSIKVYIKNLPDAIRLYKDNLSLAYFKPKETIEDMKVYQLDIDPPELEAYLDGLVIKVTPASPIEKIEFIIRY